MEQHIKSEKAEKDYRWIFVVRSRQISNCFSKQYTLFYFCNYCNQFDWIKCPQISFSRYGNVFADNGYLFFCFSFGNIKLTHVCTLQYRRIKIDFFLFFDRFCFLLFVNKRDNIAYLRKIVFFNNIVCFRVHIWVSDVNEHCPSATVHERPLMFMERIVREQFKRLQNHLKNKENKNNFSLKRVDLKLTFIR